MRNILVITAAPIVILCCRMLPAAWAQCQGQIGLAIEHTICFEARVCTGAAATGNCKPAGVFCIRSSCVPGPIDGCWWSWNWACEKVPDWSCIQMEEHEISTDCGPDCQWLSYNQCACSCQDLGLNTVESGCYMSCN